MLAIAREDPGLMLGYWNAARSAPDPVDGPWFRTGDQMEMTETGSLRFLGRADDMLNAGGFRVSPAEIEDALASFPELTECAAVETRIDAETTIIRLFYVSDHALDAGALARFASARLARYKQPRAYMRIEALPKGANGKILRRVLREMRGPDGRQA
jgi:acyl-coenzyme A synthetase/AMP-(fatty) acid ligase